MFSLSVSLVQPDTAGPAKTSRCYGAAFPFKACLRSSCSLKAANRRSCVACRCPSSKFVTKSSCPRVPLKKTLSRAGIVYVNATCHHALGNARRFPVRRPCTSCFVKSKTSNTSPIPAGSGSCIKSITKTQKPSSYNGVKSLLCDC